MTLAEKILWQRLRNNQLRGLHFRRQQVIDGFIVDFYCHAAGIVIEIDGDVHQRQVESDAERDRILAARGLRIVRIRNDEIERNISRVLKQISQICRSPLSPQEMGRDEVHS